MKDIQALIIPIIRHSLEEAGFTPVQSLELLLDYPSDSRFGDLSTNIALQLSKQAKKPPFEIAAKLVVIIKADLAKNPSQEYIKEVKVEGAGFINFYLTSSYYSQRLKEIVQKGSGALRYNIGNDRSVLIEFVSANPTGPLSVAHARQGAVGDSLANILDFLGFKVKREFYLNDEGNQINMLGESVALRLKELAGEQITFAENHYQGEYVRDIALEVKAKAEVKDLGDYAANYILEIIKKELDDFGVRFDCWYSQKELRKSGKIDSSLVFLRKQGFLYEKDGALWFASSRFGDDKDRVVIKSDGSYTYLAPDIAYHWEKYQRGFSWLINLWGPDHHGYINRLKAAVQALGYPADSLSIVIVQLASIFKGGKLVEMSTRKGQYITLREVLDEVGIDASRFFFLMRRTASHLDFDLEIAKKQTAENPVYYIQYAHARICSILRQGTVELKKDADLSVLKEKEETALIRKLLQFTYILEICLSTQDPYMLTVYLQETAEAFHKFYDQHRVLGVGDALTQARLALIEGTRVILATGLELIGVTKPERM